MTSAVADRCCWVETCTWVLSSVMATAAASQGDLASDLVASDHSPAA
jgi:hypothetical protein